MKQALVLVCAVVLTGCTGPQHTVEPVQSSSSWAQFLRAAAGPGPGLASHDPAQGNLFDQIPAWDGAAMKRCCSALPRAAWISSRCDTDAPLGGRTNRC